MHVAWKQNPACFNGMLLHRVWASVVVDLTSADNVVDAQRRQLGYHREHCGHKEGRAGDGDPQSSREGRQEHQDRCMCTPAWLACRYFSVEATDTPLSYISQASYRMPKSLRGRHAHCSCSMRGFQRTQNCTCTKEWIGRSIPVSGMHHFQKRRIFRTCCNSSHSGTLSHSGQGTLSMCMVQHDTLPGQT